MIYSSTNRRAKERDKDLKAGNGSGVGCQLVGMEGTIEHGRIQSS
jgi:hypothetical protein